MAEKSLHVLRERLEELKGKLGLLKRRLQFDAQIAFKGAAVSVHTTGGGALKVNFNLVGPGYFPSNKDIRAKRLQVIDVDGSKVGVLSPREGLALAKERGLDLVEVAPEASPPVCRIMDFSKFRVEQTKKGQAKHVADVILTGDVMTISQGVFSCDVGARE